MVGQGDVNVVGPGAVSVVGQGNVSLIGPGSLLSCGGILIPAIVETGSDTSQFSTCTTVLRPGYRDNYTVYFLLRPCKYRICEDSGLCTLVNVSKSFLTGCLVASWVGWLLGGFLGWLRG